MTTHRDARELLGAYALGQLDDVEGEAAARHLALCPECRAELAEIEPVASAMRDYWMAASTPMATDERPAAARRTRRAGWARATAAALAMAAAIGTAFVLGRAWGEDTGAGRTQPSAPPVEQLTVGSLATGITAQAGLVTHTWGTEVMIVAAGLADGGSYRVTIVEDDGSRLDAGSFLGTGERQVRCSMNAAVRREQAARIEVSDAGGAVVMAADTT